MLGPGSGGWDAFGVLQGPVGVPFPPSPDRSDLG